MDVFELRVRLVEDYARYTRSFIKIADERIKAKADGGQLFRYSCTLSPYRRS